MGKRTGRELERGDDVAEAREGQEEERGKRVGRDNTYLVCGVALEQRSDAAERQGEEKGYPIILDREMNISVFRPIAYTYLVFTHVEPLHEWEDAARNANRQTQQQEGVPRR